MWKGKRQTKRWHKIFFKNVLFKGWLLKGQSHFTQLKNICIKKFQWQKGPCKNSLEFSFKSISKRSRFTGIKAVANNTKRWKKASLSSKIAKKLQLIRPGWHDVTRSAAMNGLTWRLSVVCTGRRVHRVYRTVHNNNLRTARGGSVRKKYKTDVWKEAQQVLRQH